MEKKIFSENSTGIPDHGVRYHPGGY